MITMQMPLLNEGTDVWRPVEVTPLAGAVYRVEGPQPDDETWEFEPGTLVECKWKKFSDGELKLVPARRAPTVQSSLADHYKSMTGMAVGAAPALLVMQQLPRTPDGLPEPLPLFLSCAGLVVAATGALIWVKPKPLIVKWALYSAIGSGLFLGMITLAG
jgi:hypothetical protein